MKIPNDMYDCSHLPRGSGGLSITVAQKVVVPVVIVGLNTLPSIEKAVTGAFCSDFILRTRKY